MLVMRVTRSALRSASATGAVADISSVINAETATQATSENTHKRKSNATARASSKRAKNAETQASNTNERTENGLAAPQIPQQSNTTNTALLLPAVLTFSFEDAKQHLINVDHRFADLFSKMQCKPFQQLEHVHPFRALVTSILGQQISWMAAQSINHKFVRLYDPSMPEKPTNYSARSPTSFFPTPDQVAKTDVATLRTAGLSARKAEYVQDLASRFADGRLSTEKLMNANDEELARMLIEVKGIGRWTVDMFAIFSLRRPDILPVGDLGVQRGLVRWFLSLHSPTHSYSISPEKIKGETSAKKGKVTSVSRENEDSLLTNEDVEADPVTDLAAGTGRGKLDTPDESGASVEGVATLPPPFTPSIRNTLEKPAVDVGKEPTPLPEGLSVNILKSRLAGKNKIKGAFLTPKEMSDLTEEWKPFRSLGVYYMWSLAEGEQDEL